MEGLKTSMEKVVGMERSLNQSVRFLISDISSYVVITERIKLSIDKILSKSKFVVGDIDYSHPTEACDEQAN
jgi:hypothetical protein